MCMFVFSGAFKLFNIKKEDSRAVDSDSGQGVPGKSSLGR